MSEHDYGFSTKRLLAYEWHSRAFENENVNELEDVVKDILTPEVTRSLPSSWQGAYSQKRAEKWIKERDEEGTTLLVVESSTKIPIGLILLYESPNGKALRLGYLLARSAWGKGFASELIGAFISWCQENGISTVTGGVEWQNAASRRVLEKSGFVCEPGTVDKPEQMFVWRSDLVK